MDIIEFVKKHVQLEYVAYEYVVLKPIRGYLKGDCPFTDSVEGKSAFMINRAKQLYYCFCCLQGGDLIDFSCKMNDITPKEAAYDLVRCYNILLPAELIP